MNNKKNFGFFCQSICTVIYKNGVTKKKARNNQNAADTDSTVVDTAVISNTIIQKNQTQSVSPNYLKNFGNKRGHGKHVIEIKSLNSLPIEDMGIGKTKLMIGFKKEEMA